MKPSTAKAEGTADSAFLDTIPDDYHGVCWCGRCLSPDDLAGECAEHATCRVCRGPLGVGCPDHRRPTCSNCCEHADPIPGQLGLDGAEIIATTGRPERIGGN